MQLTACPSAEQLSHYLHGKLSASESDEIAEHVSTCAVCDITVSTLENEPDSLQFALRQAGDGGDEFEWEPELQRAISSVRFAYAEPEPPESCSVLGSVREYDLLEKIGQGGMGTVYKALHGRLKRIVALKVLAEHRLHDPAAVDRFSREMQAVGKLAHPNIVRALDAGEADGRHYLVMEYIDGIDLARLSRRCGPLPVAEACELVRQAALALQHAHEHQLVHRDIKPSNVMLTSDGQVKLLDLGIALLQPDEPLTSDLTGTGQVMGTLDYMAPEQLDNTHAVDIRADVYGLGATLYKLLCGAAPATDSQSRFRLPGESIPPVPGIRTIRPDVPKPVAAVLEKMLAPNPDQRPNTPAEAAKALEPFAAKSNLKQLALAAASDAPRITPPQQRFGGRVGKFLLGFVLLFGLVLAGFAVTVQLDQGKLVINSSVDDVQVLVKRTGQLGDSLDTLEVDKGENGWSFRSGSYEVQLVGDTDGLRVKDGTFELTRGGEKVVTIERVPAGSQNLAASGPVYEGKTLDQWIKLLQNEKSVSQRTRAIRAVGALGAEAPDEAIAALIEAASEYERTVSQSEEIQDLCVHTMQVIKRLSPDQIPQGIQDALQDRDVRKRRFAVFFTPSYWQDLKASLPMALVRKALNDSDPYVRKYVARWLPRYGKEALPDLIAALDDKDPEVRLQAVYILRDLTPETDEYVDLLIRTFGDSDINVQMAAQQSLGLLGPKAKAAVPVLLEALKRYDPKKLEPDDLYQHGISGPSRIIPKELIGTLCSIGSAAKDAVPIIKEFFQHENDQVRRMARFGFERIIGEVKASPKQDVKQGSKSSPAAPVYKGKTLDESIALLKNERSIPERLKALPAIEVLGKEEPDKAIAALLSAGSEYDFVGPGNEIGQQFRDKMATVIEQVSYERIPQVVLDALDDPDLRTRRCAALLVFQRWKHLDPAPIALARKAANDPDKYIRAISMEWLARFKNKAIPDLVEAFEDQEAVVRSQAVWAVRRIKLDGKTTGEDDRLIKSKLLKLLEDADANVRRASLNAFLPFEDDQAERVKLLAKAIGDPDREMQHEAIEFLGRMGSKAAPAVPDLLGKLKQQNRRKVEPIKLPGGGEVVHSFPITAQMISALGKIGPGAEIAVPVIKEFLEHGNSNVRQSAITAIKQITGEEIELPEQAKKSHDKTSVAGPVYDGKTFDEWITLLKTDKSGRRRVEGIKALVALHTPQNAQQAIDTVLEIASGHQDYNLGDAEPSVSRTAAQALHRMDAKLVAASLHKLLQSNDVQQRRYAAYLSSYFPLHDEFFPAIVKAAKDPDSTVRQSIASVLVKTGEQGVMELARMLSEDEDVHIRQLAAGNLASLANVARPALPQLHKAALSENERVRDLAIAALRSLKLSQQELKQIMLDALAHQNVDVRRDVAGRNGLVGLCTSEETLPALMIGLTDADESPRQGSFSTISQPHWNPDVIAAAIVKTLQDHPERKMGHAAMYLKGFGMNAGRKQVFPIMIKRYQSADPQERAAIMSMFAVMGPELKDAAPLINKALQDRDGLVREAGRRANMKLMTTQEKAHTQIPRKSESATTNAATLTLHISAAGKPAIDGIPLSDDDLKTLLAQSIANVGERGLDVVLIADEKTPADTVLKIIRACGDVGAKSVTLGKTKITPPRTDGAAVYEGRTFDEWIALLGTNDKSVQRRIDGFKALAALHTDQNAAAAIATIFDICSELARDGISKDDSDIIEAARRPLFRIGYERVVPELLKALAAEDVGRRQFATRIFPRSSITGEMAPQLLKLTDDPDERVRYDVVDLLRRAKQEGLPGLLKLIQKDQPERVRHHAAGALRGYNEAAYAALPTLIELYQSSNNQQRNELLRVIQAINVFDEKVQRLLDEAARSDDSQINRRARIMYRTLKSTGWPEAPSLTDAGVPVYRGKKFAEWVESLTTDKSPETRLHGMRAIAWLYNEDPDQAIDTVIHVGSENDDHDSGQSSENVNRAAKTALERIGYVRSVPKLLAALGSKDVRNRRFAADALSRVELPAEAIPQVVKLAGDPDERVRYNGVSLLRRVGEAGITALVSMIEDDKSPRVRIHAANNLPGVRESLRSSFSSDPFADNEQLRPALPALIKLYNSSESTERSDLLKIFRAIGILTPEIKQLLDTAAEGQDHKLAVTARSVLRFFDKSKEDKNNRRAPARRVPRDRPFGRRQRVSVNDAFISLKIDAEGKLSIKGEPLEMAELKRMLAEKVKKTGDLGVTVRISADPKAQAEAVLAVTSACREAGVNRVMLGETSISAPANSNQSGALYDGRTFDQWVVLLKTDKSARRQLEGIKALAALRSEENTPLVVETIIKIAADDSRIWTGKSDPDVAGAAQFILAEVGKQHVMPQLLAALKSDNVSKRRFAAEALNQYPVAEEMVPVILKLADDADDQVRYASTSLLRNLGEPGVASLAKMVEQDATIPIRARAADSLSVLGEKARPAVPTLLNALLAENFSLRDSAISALQQIKPDQKLLNAALLRFVKNDIPIVQNNISLDPFRLIDKTSTATIPALLAGLADVDEHVRYAARQAFEKLDANRATKLPALLAALNDNKYKYKMYIVDLLAQYGSQAKAAIPALIELYATSDDQGHRTLLHAYEKIDLLHKDVHPLLRQAAQSDDDGLARLAKKLLAAVEKQTAAKPATLVIKIAAGGKLALDGESLDLAGLKKQLAVKVAKLGRKSVIVNIIPGPQASHGDVTVVLKACEEAGILGTSTITIPDKETSPIRQKSAALYDGKTLDQWLAILKTETEPKKQMEAIKAVGATGARSPGREAEAVAALMNVLRQTPLAVYGVAITLAVDEELEAKFDLPDTSTELGKYQASQFELAIAIATALQQFGDPSSGFEGFSAALSDPDERVRLAAGSMMQSWWPSNDYVEKVLGLLDSKNTLVKHWAISNLAELADKVSRIGRVDGDFSELFLPLLDILEKESDRKTRRIASRELRGFIDENSPFPARIVDTEGAVDRLFALGKDKDREVRDDVLRVLEKIEADPDRLIPLLAQAILVGKSTSQSTHVYQLASLAKQRKAAAEALVQVYPDLNHQLQYQIINQLRDGGTNGAVAIPLLRKVSESEDSALRAAAIEALKLIRSRTRKSSAVYDGKTLDEWITMLRKERNPEKRMETLKPITVLGKVQPDDVVSTLAEVAEEYDHLHQTTSAIEYGSAYIIEDPEERILYDLSDAIAKLSNTRIRNRLIESLSDAKKARRRFAYYHANRGSFFESAEGDETLLKAILQHARKGLSDDDAYVRFVALGLINYLPEETPVQLYLDAVADKDHDVQAFAVQLLHQFLKLEQLPDVHQGSTRPSFREQLAVQPDSQKLEQFKQLDYVEQRLFETASPGEADLQPGVMILLIRIGADRKRLAKGFEKEVDEELKDDELWGSKSFRVALYGLGQLGENASFAVPKLIKLLKKYQTHFTAAERGGGMGQITVSHNQDEIEREIIETLGQIGAKAAAALPELQKRFAFSDEETKKAAQKAVKLIGVENPATVK